MSRHDGDMTENKSTQEITITESRQVGITSREHRLGELLSTIADANQQGLHPSKADLTRGLANRTRASHYRLVDELIRRGLAENNGIGNTYALDVTDAGAEIVAGAERVTVHTERRVAVERTWTVVETTVDGARFTWRPHNSFEAAAAEAQAHATGEHLAKVEVVERVRPRFARVPADMLPEPVVTVVWER